MVFVLIFDEAFLKTVGSESYQGTAKVKIRFFFTWINKFHPEITDILAIPGNIFQEYFVFIDNKKQQAQGKKRTRKILFKYINWYRRTINIPRSALKYDYDDIFDEDAYTFKETGTHRDETPLTMEWVVDCLRYWRTRSYEDYIFFSLLAYSAMRIQAATKIELAKIDLVERKIVTNDKITKWFGKENAYIIPKSFVVKLESFIEEIRLTRPNQKTLFRYIPAIYRRHIKEWADNVKQRKGWNIDMHPHLFRDAINTFFKENGLVLEEDRCLILIQMPKGVNPQVYLKRMKDFEFRRNLYDRYFPFKEPLP